MISRTWSRSSTRTTLKTRRLCQPRNPRSPRSTSTVFDCVGYAPSRLLDARQRQPNTESYGGNINRRSHSLYHPFVILPFYGSGWLVSRISRRPVSLNTCPYTAVLNHQYVLTPYTGRIRVVSPILFNTLPVLSNREPQLLLRSYPDYIAVASAVV